MSTLDELIGQLTPDATPDVDWDAPEAGKFPPRLWPGPYLAVFNLPDDESKQFDIQEKKDDQGNVIKKSLRVAWLPTIQPTDVAKQVVDAKAYDGGPIKLGFQRASFAKSEKQKISKGGELLRSMGTTNIEMAPSVVVKTMQGLSGKGIVNLKLKWRTYCSDCRVSISTNPMKATGGYKAEVAWPKMPDGKPHLQVKCPECGVSMYGQEEADSYLLPKGNVTGVTAGQMPGSGAPTSQPAAAKVGSDF